MGALLGGGTGLVAVPALGRFTGLPRVKVHGTVTIANIAVAIVGATVYGLRGGALDTAIGIPLMAGGVLGAVGGARLVVRVPEKALRTVFVAVLVVVGVKLLLDALHLDVVGGGDGLRLSNYASGVAIVLAVLVGVLVGAWSAALGLGGGLLTVPVLVLLFGATLHTAEGTSLLVMLPNSLTGAITHLRQRTASPGLGAELAAGAAIGACGGAFLALALPNRVIGLIFGVFVLCIALRELRRLAVKSSPTQTGGTKP
jgi:uncharacterized membrane protein YfcA